MILDPERLSTARLSNGVSLAFTRNGRGVPLVFIHGVMGDWRSWAPQWETFTARYDCTTYSRRYNYPNDNRMPSPHHSALNDAEDLGHLLDGLGITRVILVGSSYGAFTALAFAAAHPERCHALALSEPPMMRYAAMSDAGRTAEADFRARAIEPANAAFRRGDDAEGARIMTGGINAVDPASLSAAAMQSRIQNMTAMKMLALSSDEFPWIAPEVLAALSMPILMLSGRNTAPIHAEIFRNVCAAMPECEVAIVESSGHSTSRDNPEIFNRLVLEFLTRRVRT